MGGHGADALDLVGADSDAETGPADEQGAVDLAIGHELRGGCGAVRVGCLVVDGQTTDVYDGLDAGVVLEVALDFVFVADASVLEKYVSPIQRLISCLPAS